MGKNIRRKQDKPRWSDADRIQKHIKDIDKMDPDRKNPELQKKRRELSVELFQLNGIW